MPPRWRELVHEKTAGNPFFAIQFISALAEEGLLTFDHGNARWSWDLNRIHAKGYTDNVVDLMVGKLNRLPVETQKALQQLACLGNSAEFALLATVYQDSKEDMHGDLREAVRTGLVLRSEDAYQIPPRPRPGSSLFTDPGRRCAPRPISESAGCSRHRLHQRSERRRSSRSSISSTVALASSRQPRSVSRSQNSISLRAGARRPRPRTPRRFRISRPAGHC